MAETADSDAPEQISGKLSNTGARQVIVVVIFLACGAIAGYFYALQSIKGSIQARDDNILRLTRSAQQLELKLTQQDQIIAKKDEELKHAQAKMAAMVPAKNTYNLQPNQSIIVADGHLTIGLIGAPTNSSVNININGKNLTAAAGDVMKIAPDPSTACQIRVESFDMFEAVVNAICQPSNDR